MQDQQPGARLQVEQQRRWLVGPADKTGFTLHAIPTDETSDAAPVEHTESAAQKVKPDERRTDVEAMRATVKAGVQVVTAPQLFPTPPDLAARMLSLAGLVIGMRVPEPSAGTGWLLEALPGIVPFGQVLQTALQVVAVEVNPALAARLPPRCTRPRRETSCTSA